MTKEVNDNHSAPVTAMAEQANNDHSTPAPDSENPTIPGDASPVDEGPARSAPPLPLCTRNCWEIISCCYTCETPIESLEDMEDAAFFNCVYCQEKITVPNMTVVFKQYETDTGTPGCRHCAGAAASVVRDMRRENQRRAREEKEARESLRSFVWL
jgi:hypothetical protein